MSDIVERLRMLQTGAAWVCEETSATLEDAADDIERLRAARDIAIKEMADMARQAGSWRGIAEGKDIVIQQLEAERERLKAIVNWLNPQGLAVGPITNTKERRHEADE